jgi:hypothetical protein
MRFRIIFLMVLALFLVSCSNPEAESQYEQELGTLSDLEIVELKYLEETEADAALAGEASRYRKAGSKYNKKVPSTKSVKKSRRMKILEKVAAERRAKATTKTSLSNVPTSVSNFIQFDFDPSCTCLISDYTTGLPGVNQGRLGVTDDTYNPEGPITFEIPCRQKVGIEHVDTKTCKDEPTTNHFVFKCVAQDKLVIVDRQLGSPSCLE